METVCKPENPTFSGRFWQRPKLYHRATGFPICHQAPNSSIPKIRAMMSMALRPVNTTKLPQLHQVAKVEG